MFIYLFLLLMFDSYSFKFLISCSNSTHLIFNVFEQYSGICLLICWLYIGEHIHLYFILLFMFVSLLVLWKQNFIQIVIFWAKYWMSSNGDGGRRSRFRNLAVEGDSLTVIKKSGQKLKINHVLRRLYKK